MFKKVLAVAVIAMAICIASIGTATVTQKTVAQKSAVCDYDMCDEKEYSDCGKFSIVDPVYWLIKYIWYGQCSMDMDADKDGDCDKDDLWGFVVAARDFTPDDMADLKNSLRVINADGYSVAIVGDVDLLEEWYMKAVTVSEHVVYTPYDPKPYLCGDYACDAMKVARKHFGKNVLHIAVSRNHAYNAFLICDDWKNVNCWMCLEPQTGEFFKCTDGDGIHKLGKIDIVDFDNQTVQSYIINGTYLNKTYTGYAQFDYYTKECGLEPWSED